MPYTVRGAFDAFRKTTVDLDSMVTATARSSRDYLYSQLKGLADKDASFPRLTGEFRPFGSFARRTRIRPLNDIDFLVALVGRGTTSTQSSGDPYTYWLKIDDSTAPLNAFRDEYGYVSSIKVLNKIKSSLATVPNYSRAEIKRNMQAVTLKLLSYDWVFDIVPAVPISNSFGGTAYYLIPNGRGDWIRTDPRIDDANATRLNTQHSSQFLPTVRILKYWNGRTTKPVLTSYYFETLALKVFDYAPAISSFPTAVKYFFDTCPIYLASSCPDPKGLGPALDAGVDAETKRKVLAALSSAASWASLALSCQSESKDKEAIDAWGNVFGGAFPKYG